MNLTVFSLHLSSSLVNSPFFCTNSHGSFSFSRLSLTRFSSNFLFLEKGNSISIKYSRFCLFLKTAIIVDSFEIDNKIFNNESLIFDNDLDVNINNCIFTNCFSCNQSSAIQVSWHDYYLPFVKIADTSFIDCVSESSGGAITVFAQKTTLTSLCFHKCFSSQAGQACTLFNKGANPANYKYITIVDCSSRPTPSQNMVNGVIRISNSQHVFSYSNLSMNSHHNFDRCLFFGTELDLLKISTATYFNNSGITAFELRNFINLEFTHCNIANNNITNSFFLINEIIEVENPTLTITNFVIVNNNFSGNISKSRHPITVLIFNSVFDIEPSLLFQDSAEIVLHDVVTNTKATTMNLNVPVTLHCIVDYLTPKNEKSRLKNVLLISICSTIIVIAVVASIFAYRELLKRKKKRCSHVEKSVSSLTNEICDTPLINPMKSV